MALEFIQQLLAPAPKKKRGKGASNDPLELLQCFGIQPRPRAENKQERPRKKTKRQ